MQNRISLLKDEVEKALAGRSECHGFSHALNVATLAHEIAVHEKLPSKQIDICMAIALMHDIWDHKFCKDQIKTRETWHNKLVNTHSFTSEEAGVIIADIDLISFSKGLIPETLSGRIVQDADRICGAGAIGIARAITYGAIGNRPFSDSVGHLQDKFLKSGMKMNTVTGGNIFRDRCKTLQVFIKQFELENKTVF